MMAPKGTGGALQVQPKGAGAVPKAKAAPVVARTATTKAVTAPKKGSSLSDRVITPMKWAVADEDHLPEGQGVPQGKTELKVKKNDRMVVIGDAATQTEWLEVRLWNGGHEGVLPRAKLRILG
jgi:SH3 domain